jgi:tRNA uridine 5-carboxymethylaminomethyl modification enzyme
VYAGFEEKYRDAERLRCFLGQHRWTGSEAMAPGTGGCTEALKGATLEQLLRRPEISLADLEPVLRAHNLWLPGTVRRAVETEIRYQGYIELQRRDAEKLKGLGARRIPENLDYSAVDGLSREIREKLSRIRPRDLGMAGRIPGVTPAALSILNLYLELRGAKKPPET